MAGMGERSVSVLGECVTDPVPGDAVHGSEILDYETDLELCEEHTAAGVDMQHRLGEGVLCVW